MPIFAIFGHFMAIFGRFGPFLDREHQKQCNCNLLGATGPTNYINMLSNGYLEIWSVSDPKTNSGAKQDPKLTWGGQNWSFCTLCSPTNLFYTKNVNSEMVTSKSYFLAWNCPTGTCAFLLLFSSVICERPIVTDAPFCDELLEEINQLIKRSSGSTMWFSLNSN